MSEEVNPQEPGMGATKPIPVIEDIQVRKDGTYVVTLDGYPYHATASETPEVFQLVLQLIKAGANVTECVEPVIVEPSPEELATDEYNRLRLSADFTIAPLQDAADLDEATPEETAKLKAWRQYRVKLSRVHSQPGYPLSIEWPSLPA